MACFCEANIERLKALGILVASGFGPKHVLRDGIRFYKPTPEEIAENAREKAVGQIVVITSPHTLVAYKYDESWFVDAIEHTGGLGPGNFVAIFKTEEESVLWGGVDAMHLMAGAED